MDKSSLIKLRVFLWSILGLAVLWLLWQGIVPTGQITYEQDFGEDSYFIRKFTPEERVEFSEEGGPKIIGDPVYFSLRTPRRFNEAEMEIKYKNESDLPVIEAGVLVDKTVWRYDLKPVGNKVIDQLAVNWDVLQSDGTMLLQKEKKYNTIEEFLNNLPGREEIAVYNYDLKSEYLLPGYEASQSENKIDFALRGAYQFYTYLKDEELSYSFLFLDLNKNKDSDPIELILYYDGQLIDSRRLDDDGVAIDSGELSGEREFGLSLKNLPEGVYKIEVKANDDIITKKINTKQKITSFENKIWLAENDSDSLKLFTDSTEINAQTINPQKLQIIKIDDQELSIDETYRQFSLDIVSTSTKEVVIEKDGIILAGDGVFSFDKNSLINPNFKKVGSHTDINNTDVKYVIANYIPPENDGLWKVATVNFDLSNTYREDYKYSFLISVPGLKSDDNIEDFVEIESINFYLSGTSLWKKIKKTIFN